jgi:hypothetical protein
MDKLPYILLMIGNLSLFITILLWFLNMIKSLIKRYLIFGFFSISYAILAASSITLRDPWSICYIILTLVFLFMSSAFYKKEKNK